MSSKKEIKNDDSKEHKIKDKTSSKWKSIREKIKHNKKQSIEKTDNKSEKKRSKTIRSKMNHKDDEPIILGNNSIEDTIIESDDNQDESKDTIRQTRVSPNEKLVYILDSNVELDSEKEDDFNKEVVLNSEFSQSEEFPVDDKPVEEERIEEKMNEATIDDVPVVVEVVEKEEISVDDNPVEEEKNINKSKEKLKLKKGPRIIVFVGILVFLLLLVLLFLIHKNSSAQNNYSPSKKKIDVQKEEVDYEAKVFMVGDALIHWGVYNDAKQDDGSYDFKPMFQFVKPISSKYDIAYYNQETILGGTGMGLSSYPRFNSPQEVGDAFLDAGFNMVSLATNHTMDKGENGVLKSVEYWKNHPEVAASGQWSSEEERTASIQTVYEVNHIKYAFISYTIWTNGLETPYGKDYLNSVYSDEKAKVDIESVRDKVDFVIVAMHWGTEYAFYVDRKQEQIANYLSDLGVDLIIGAHPHVVQPVEYINNNKTFVVYSLGNFISDQLDVDNYTGLGMEVTLKKHIGLDGNSINSVVEPKAELFYTVTTQRRGWSSDFRVKTYPSLDESELRNHASLYEHYKSIVNDRYPDLTWGLTWE